MLPPQTPPSITSPSRQNTRPAVADADRTAVATDCLRFAAGESPNEIATRHRHSSGQWLPTTRLELWERVRRAAEAMRTLGLERGDRLAVFARTCREWQIAEHAGGLAGAVIVGVDPGATSEQIDWLFRHANVSSLVVDTPERLSKVPAALRSGLKFVLLIEPGATGSQDANVRSWEDVLVGATPLPTHHPTVDPDDPAMLIYTSGTTGHPKAIEYSHRQLAIACEAMLDEFPDLREWNRFACWLPMSALFQRMINHVALASRSSTFFVENPREIMARIGEIRPTVFFSVPRFYEQLHDGMRAQLAKGSPLIRRVAATALATGTKWARCAREGTKPGWWLRLRHRLADRLVLRRLRAAMGGEIKWMITGSAAAPSWLLEFYQSIGLLLLEAYGVTENPVPIAANHPDAYRFGSVGKPFAMNQLRITDDGEIQVKGPAVFRGYRGDAQAVERFTPDGYYRTGDLGRLDADGFLYLTGRIAELIKTSAGRRISPAAIEAVYKESRYIDQMVVCRDNQPYLVGLVSINAPAVGSALGLADASSWQSSSDAVMRLIQDELQSFGVRLARHEQVRDVRILPESLSVERGELTPTLKLRRDRIQALHGSLINSMYPTVREGRSA